MSSEVTVCGCGAPLIWTFVFAGAEYYCLDCGNKYGMFGPGTADATPELLADLEARKAEWQPIAEALLVGGSKLEACPKCWGPGANNHPVHATDAERAADVAAREWLTQRLKAAAAG